ncbi:MAG: FAD-binding oxidoreductase [Candidatus Helarchaeota archaeon]
MVNEGLISDLVELFGKENVFYRAEELIELFPEEILYGEFKALVLVRPSEIRQLNRLLILMKRHKISGLTPLGSGNTLGAYSKYLIIDLSNFNNIIEIDDSRYIATIEAGVKFNELNAELKKRNLTLPLIPPIDGTMGGLISTPDVQIGSFKYGNIGNYLRHVSLFSSKKLVKLGTKNTPPFTCGYNLTNLLYGSMGFYGLIIDMTLELIPIPEKQYEISIMCEKLEDIVKIFQILKDFESLTNLTIQKSRNDIEILINLEGFSDLVQMENEKLLALTNVNVEGIDSKYLLNILRIHLENQVYEQPRIIPSSKLQQILNNSKNSSFIIHFISDSNFMFSTINSNDKIEVKKNLNKCSLASYFSKENFPIIKKLKEIIDPSNLFQPGMIDQ